MNDFVIANARTEQGICSLRVRQGIIAEVIPGILPGADLDLQGRILMPGLIDIHFHGARGSDCLDGDLGPLCAYLAANGVTAFLPTLSTCPVETIRKATAAKQAPGARSLGFHLEGPFLSLARSGAQNREYLRNPDWKLLEGIPDIRMITVAPELPGALDFIRQAPCLIAIGHTDCDYERALAAMDAGANGLTHLYNAMPPLLHRAPGPIGAGFERRCYAQLICDGIHVHKAAVLAAWRLFGTDRMILISDSIRPAGLPDGDYESDGYPVQVRGNHITLEGGVLAGSAATLWQCVKKAVSFGIPFWDAVRMASRTPAEQLGVQKGRLEPGFDADFVALDEAGEPERVWIGGEEQKIDRTLFRP